MHLYYTITGSTVTATGYINGNRVLFFEGPIETFNYLRDSLFTSSVHFFFESSPSIPNYNERDTD